MNAPAPSSEQLRKQLAEAERAVEAAEQLAGLMDTEAGWRRLDETRTSRDRLATQLRANERREEALAAARAANPHAEEEIAQLRQSISAETLEAENEDAITEAVAAVVKLAELYDRVTARAQAARERARRVDALREKLGIYDNLPTQLTADPWQQVANIANGKIVAALNKTDLSRHARNLAADIRGAL